MRLHNFGYLVKEGSKNVVRNRLMSFACIGVLVACMLLIGSAAMISLNVNAMVNFIEDQNEAVVYLEEWMTSGDIEVMDLSLAGFENLASYTFVSKEEALEQLIEEAGDDAELYIGLRGADNPLLDKYIVTVDDLAFLDDTVARLRETHGVYRVNSSTEVAGILVALRQAVAYCGAVVVLILVVVSLAIITNNIKLTIFARRREINIMKYVGATDSFIRMPFLVEGIIIGLVSAATAFLILGFGYTYLLQWIGENFGDFIGPVFERAIDFWQIAPYIFGAFSVLGVFIGAVGSSTFVKKYLKV